MRELIPSSRLELKTRLNSRSRSGPWAGPARQNFLHPDHFGKPAHQIGEGYPNWSDNSDPVADLTTPVPLEYSRHGHSCVAPL